MFTVERAEEVVRSSRVSILSCAAAGQGNKEIADRLCVSLDTVKTHLHHIYQKLQVSGRVEAILTYLSSNKV